jgi:uncharacterized protein
MKALDTIALIAAFVLLSLQTASAAYPDSSPGRIAAVDLFRADLSVPYPLMDGPGRVATYKSICKMEKPYYPSCNYKSWTDENGRGNLSSAGDFFGSRCKKGEPLSCVVFGWSNGYLNGAPSAEAKNPSKAVDNFRFACKKKAYAPACSHLGDMYAAGVGVEQDYKEAMSFYSQGCKAKDPYGCYRKGTLYWKGKGVAKDVAEAKKLMTQGCSGNAPEAWWTNASSGYSQACIDLGLLQESQKDFNGAFKSFEKACQGKNGDGCYHLGRIHMGKTSDSSSPPIALGLFTGLCDRNDHRSCYGIGQIFEKGLGVDRSVEQASEKYEKACDAGYSAACSPLGELILYDMEQEKTPEDIQRAISLIETGCEGGDVHGCVIYARMLQKGELIPQDIGRALKYYKDGCTIDEGEACYAMGVGHDKGEHLEKDPKAALGYYRKGCDLLHGPSCGELGFRYLQGTGGVIKNSKEALRYLQDGCKLGHHMSCASLGDFYIEGSLVERDVNKALELFETACDIAHLPSCVKAGQLIVDGLIENANYFKALTNFEKACKAGMKEACDAAIPIMFQARFEGIVENALKSNMCQVWTSNDDNPDKNKQVVTVNQGKFEVLDGRNKGQTFEANLDQTKFSEEVERSLKRAESYWTLDSGKKQLQIEHHENWYTERFPVTAFPKDESFSKEMAGDESIYFSRDREVITRNLTVKRRAGASCKFVDSVFQLSTEHCSEIQALLAAQLVTHCR